MEGIYQKITLSQEDGKKLEVKSGQTSVRVSPTSEDTDSQENSGNISTKKSRKDVTVKVTGIESKIFRGDLNG